MTTDLASSWQKALATWVPHARVVFDRFHVERLASDAVDEVRRSEQRRLDPEDAQALKGTRYALLKHPARLKPEEARRLETLRRENRALDRAYELKEYLATILGQATPEDAPALLEEWLEWAARSRLAPFVKLGRTIRKHAEGILAYLDTRMTNGPRGGYQQQAARDCAARVRLSLGWLPHVDAVPVLWRHRTGAAPTHTRLRRFREMRTVLQSVLVSIPSRVVSPVPPRPRSCPLSYPARQPPPERRAGNP